MFDLNAIVRANILSLKPYSSARDEFSGEEGVFLDANENPFGSLNRYPDPYQRKLKMKIAETKQVPKENIFIGNGSDEVLDLALRIFCSPGKDKALTFSPTYGIYDVATAVNDIELIKVPLNGDFQIELTQVQPLLKDQNLKLIFICTPNNPTGNIISKAAIESILSTFKGIVLIDEAYIDFSGEESWLKYLPRYPNLIVSQTFSKAWGLAAARVGTAFSSKEIIDLFNKVKPPYNVSGLNQKAAIDALADQEAFEKNKSTILNEMQRVEESLSEIPCVQKIYPSDANFILIQVTDANRIYDQLVQKNIITRNRNNLVRNCIRITIGSPEENSQLLSLLKTL